MKFQKLTTLATPLLVLTINLASTQMATAQDAVTSPEQPEPPVAPVQDDANENREAVPLADTDCVDLPDAASENAPAAGAANAQTDANAQASRAEQNRDDQAARNSATQNANPQIAQNRDDCLDIRSSSPPPQD